MSKPAAHVTHAPVTLFKPSGKYYTSETWRIPAGAIGPYDMADSPDFRRISDGPVLIQADPEVGNDQEGSEGWGYPHLIM